MSSPTTRILPLSLITEIDSNIISIKNIEIKDCTTSEILDVFSFASTFDQFSQLVDAYSEGSYYIAKPKSASSEDCSSCLNHLQELILKALKGKNSRKNCRGIKLISAAKIKDDFSISRLLASASWSYWQDHGFTKTKKEQANLAAYSMIKNAELNKENKEFRKAQIEYIGAAVSFEKARKKEAFQEVFDFEETEKIAELLFMELDND